MLIVVFAIYVISDPSIISSFNQGLSDGTAGR
ncbi:plantaricin biosynthesis protein PlnR [Lactiplantibacillus plantarum]|nr:plantaricin biosynthesis protein PlnR [Lactiplantibacillus plantarum]